MLLVPPRVPRMLAMLSGKPGQAQPKVGIHLRVALAVTATFVCFEASMTQFIHDPW